MRNIRQLHPVKRTTAWWNGGHSTSAKLGYYPAMVVSYARYAHRKEKRINYLGRELSYDNVVAPLTLMYYPHEISRKILSNIHTPINHLLDVGGNIGQFSLTFQHLSPATTIHCFEPNPFSFKLLKKNVKGNRKIKIYNYGVGPSEKQVLHFSPTQSSIGSLLVTNSKTEITKDTQEITIKVTDNVALHTRRKEYDLIKIDVEGYEYNVIKSLRGLTTKYLFIEMSGYSRDKDAVNSRVLSEIETVLGEYNILNITEANAKSDSFDMLLSFEK